MTSRNNRWTNNVPRPHHATAGHGMSDSGSRHIGRRGDPLQAQRGALWRGVGMAR